MRLRTDAATVPLAAVVRTMQTAPEAVGDFVEAVWRAGLTVSGPPRALRGQYGRSLTVLEVVRLVGLHPEAGAETLDGLLAAASPVEPGTPGVHPAATAALGRAGTMRWVTANASHVAASPQWRSVLPGMAGVTVSVPLAEEAFTALLRHRAELPRIASAFVQLNPWFSRWFAARFRRRIKGKRIRVTQRAATARAWSHARTTVSHQIPEEWRSLQGRGVGRPLDRWSEQLLIDYVQLFDRLYPEGIPPTIASLYVVARAALKLEPPDPAVTVDWDVLPAATEARARELLGLAGGPTTAAPEIALRRVARVIGDDPDGWVELIDLAYQDGRGMTAATEHLLQHLR